MKQIDKTKKGIIFCCWEPEDQEIFRQAVESGLTPVYCLETNLWIPYNVSLLQDFTPDSRFRHYAWWIKEWDEPSGEQLVGKLCKLWNHDYDNDTIAVVRGYNSDKAFPYFAAGRYWKFARALTLKEAEQYILGQSNSKKLIRLKDIPKTQKEPRCISEVRETIQQERESTIYDPISIEAQKEAERFS